MKLELSINLDNAAFYHEEDFLPEPELRRIFTEIIAEHFDGECIYDINGNKIGQYGLMPNADE
ncbi:MAG: hypothetical protein GY853_13680 [PVC group bacterium]|nr:hypothetical protein [PVC group bacterium]